MRIIAFAWEGQRRVLGVSLVVPGSRLVPPAGFGVRWGGQGGRRGVEATGAALISRRSEP